MKVGILQAGRTHPALAQDHGEYPEMFARLLEGNGFEFEAWPVLDGEFPDAPSCAEGWLITGSRFGTYEKLPWIAHLEAFIRRTCDEGVPLVGVCFGHQIVAQALGGHVEKFSGGWSVGRIEYDIETEDAPLSLLSWHQDQVVRLPPDAKVVGSSGSCRYAMLEYGRRALTLQPHPEFDPSFVSGLIDSVGPRILDADRLERTRAGLDGPLHNRRIARILADFLLQRSSNGRQGDR